MRHGTMHHALLFGPEMESGNEARTLMHLQRKCKVSFMKHSSMSMAAFMTMLMVEWLTGVYALIWCLL